MEKIKTTFIIDPVEFRYYEFNPLVTSFWLIKECHERGFEVYISTADQLFLKTDKAYCNLFQSHFKSLNGKKDMTLDKTPKPVCLDEMNLVCFRPDPPVDISYITATYILDYIDRNHTLLVNDPTGIRTANEKLYINRFADMVPPNVTTKKVKILKQFLEEYKNIIIKPLNKCFGKGVFFLKEGDINRNSILDSATDFGKNYVMAQQFVRNEGGTDKRVNIICGDLMEETVSKIPGEGDFKFNQHNDKYFVKAELTTRERDICNKIAPQLMKDGLYMAGLDFIQDMIIEINVTSPCFFIKETNRMYNTNFEKKIIDKICNQMKICQPTSVAS